MTTLRSGTLTLPGSRPAENPLPFFRDRAAHREVVLQDSVAPRYRQLAGWNTGTRILPYAVQDRYDRAQRPLTLRTVVLENRCLRAEFLPELGGRLRSLYHKPRQRELLACNPVLQPANLAIRNAWFSGGIEWNVGQYGHSVFTCAPIFAAQIEAADGSPGLRLYEFERMHRLFWQTDFYLPPDSEFLFAYTRVVNPGAEPASLYWWTNMAVPEAPDVRVIAPATEALSLATMGGFDQAPLPGLPSLAGRDGTYAVNSPNANEFFMQCEDSPRPFIAALDGRGSGLVEASTGRLGVRKLFCWGMNPGGRRWQEYLSPTGPAYIEIQAGLAPTQLHGAVLPPRSAVEWTEAFGLLEADPRRVHSTNWTEAVSAAQDVLDRSLPAARLEAIASACRARADLPAAQIIQSGSGWGALEIRRRQTQGETLPPPAFVFPEETLMGEPIRWLPLLDGGVLSATPGPVAWMVQPEWHDLLSASLDRPGGRHALALLHLGVMRCESGDEARADAAWLESIAREPSVWAWRNRGALARRRGQWPEARAHYAAAWAHAAALEEPGRMALAREIMQLQLAAGDPNAAAAFHACLSATLQDDDGVQLARAQAALARGELDLVEAVLQREFTQIREGELSLTELWDELWIQREAAGRPVTPDLRRMVRAKHPPPRCIDFRLLTD